MSNPNDFSEQIRGKPIADLPDAHPAKQVVDKAKKVIQRRAIAQNRVLDRDYYKQIHDQQQYGDALDKFNFDLSRIALAGTMTAGLIAPPLLTLAMLKRRAKPR